MATRRECEEECWWLLLGAECEMLEGGLGIEMLQKSTLHASCPHWIFAASMRDIV